MEEIKAKIKFDGDSKNYHRFKIIHPEGQVVGVIYLDQKLNPLPQKVVLETGSNELN